MKSSQIVAVLIAGAVCGCGDSGHPQGDEILRARGSAVAKVNGRAIAQGEAEAFAAKHLDGTPEDLIEREILAQRALEEGVDVEFERKRAMVDAFLVDEIEAAVSHDDVTESTLAAARKEVTEELNAPGGYECVAVRIFALELVRGNPPPERAEELKALVLETAQRLYASLPDSDAQDDVRALDLSKVDPAVEVNVFESKVVDPEQKVPVKGWSRAPRLAASMATIPDGAKSPIFVTNDSPIFAVRVARVDPKTADDEAIERAAKARALAATRAVRTEALLKELRDKSSVVMHSEVLEGGM